MTERQRPAHQGNLYDLTPAEFERLVAEIFAQEGYSEVKVVGGPADQGIDIITVSDGKPVAIQVKHKTRLTLREIQQFVDRYFSNPSAPRILIFVTSADLPQDASSVSQRIPPGAELRILGRQDIQGMLAQHTDVSDRFLGLAMQRTKSQRQRLVLSTIAGLLSIVGVLASISSIFVWPHKAPLDKRIETVEKALTSIRDLETYLGEIKRDMADTEKATEVINQKYAQAKELEKITDIQLAALKTTLEAQTWRRTLFNYVMGFVLGVASSFVASVLHANWRQRKALE